MRFRWPTIHRPRGLSTDRGLRLQGLSQPFVNRISTDTALHPTGYVDTSLPGSGIDGAPEHSSERVLLLDDIPLRQFRVSGPHLLSCAKLKPTVNGLGAGRVQNRSGHVLHGTHSFLPAAPTDPHVRGKAAEVPQVSPCPVVTTGLR